MAQQGVLDTTFNTDDDGLQGDGFDSTVRTLALQSDLGIVGGDYLYFNGTSLPYLSRLKASTVDASFNLGVVLMEKYCSLIQPDGKIMIAGSFTSFNGIAIGRIIRLNSNGSRDDF
jgi:hypothetical protein